MSDYVRVDTEDYSALYVDGVLEMYSESYLVDEHLFFTVLGGQQLSSKKWYSVEDYEMPKFLSEYVRDLEEM